MAKTNDEIQKAQEELDKDKPEKAMGRYEKAQKYAPQSMKHDLMMRMKAKRKTTMSFSRKRKF